MKKTDEEILIAALKRYNIRIVEQPDCEAEANVADVIKALRKKDEEIARLKKELVKQKDDCTHGGHKAILKAARLETKREAFAAVEKEYVITCGRGGEIWKKFKQKHLGKGDDEK